MDDDHNYFSNNECIDVEHTFVENVEFSSANITIEEKEGDDFLIELYIERIYLYDKSHRDFKNKIIKENAWVEISNIMQQKNLGNYIFTMTVI